MRKYLFRFAFIVCLFWVSVLDLGTGAVLDDGFDWRKPIALLANRKLPLDSLFQPYFNFMDNVFETLEGKSEGVNVSEQCQAQMKQLLKSVEMGDTGALSILDATGKPGSGILKGGISLLGYYSQCLDAKIANDSIPPVAGMYCLIKFKFHNDTTIFPKASFNVLTQDQYRPTLGLCIPSACTTGDVYIAINDSSPSISGEIIEKPECHIKSNDQLDSSAACVLAIFIIFAFIAVFATVYENYYQRRSKTSNLKTKSSSYGTSLNETPSLKPTGDELGTPCQESGSTIQLHNPKSNEDKGNVLEPFILAFSMTKNASKVFSVETTGDSVGALHGLRFLSMALIIFGHTYSFATQDMYFRNIDVVSNAPKSFAAQILSNGTLAVDTFYFISGLLVALVTLKVMKHKNGKLPILHFYIHRYLRLTPLFLIVIAFSATLLQYLSSGPTWNFSIMMYSAWCKTNWYLNALYVHNFVHTSNMCLSHSWYLATDMQFYIVTPLIIIPLYKNRLWGALVIAAFLAASTITTGVITAINKFPAIPYVNNAEPLELMNEYYTQVYTKPYCRMGPYLVGIIIGYIFWKYKAVEIKKLYVAIGWGLTAFLMLFVLFIMQGANEGNLPSVAVAVAYSSLARTAWAAGLGWLTMMCHYGYGGFVNSILSFKYFMPFSRLTYSAYLIHPVIMAVYYGSVETTVDFSYSFMLYLFIGHCVITYVTSLALSLLFESPIIGLEKALKEGKK